MKFYTKTGDVGNTSLFTGERVAKFDLRVEAYGTLDELQAFLGMSRACCDDLEIKGVIVGLENMLTKVMGEVASTGGKGIAVTEEAVSELERMIDYFTEQTPPMKSFEIPGASNFNATLHVSRTVARRAERRLWELAENHPVRSTLVIWVNRLSDLLFALTRYYDNKAE